MKQLITLLLLISLCPMWAKAQSIEEIHRAMDAYDYEMPIAQIAPASGDTLFTPLRAKALRAMNRYPEALKEWTVFRIGGDDLSNYEKRIGIPVKIH